VSEHSSSPVMTAPAPVCGGLLSAPVLYPPPLPVPANCAIDLYEVRVPDPGAVAVPVCVLAGQRCPRVVGGAELACARRRRDAGQDRRDAGRVGEPDLAVSAGLPGRRTYERPYPVRVG
jgi:hypothetical protein